MDNRGGKKGGELEKVAIIFGLYSEMVINIIITYIVVYRGCILRRLISLVIVKIFMNIMNTIGIWYMVVCYAVINIISG